MVRWVSGSEVICPVRHEVKIRARPSCRGPCQGSEPLIRSYPGEEAVLPAFRVAELCRPHCERSECRRPQPEASVRPCPAGPCPGKAQVRPLVVAFVPGPVAFRVSFPVTEGCVALLALRAETSLRAGRDLICIQSVDGMLMVFEQESYAFGRFLPGALLPGPLAYSPRTDAFITVSSCRQVESYNSDSDGSPLRSVTDTPVRCGVACCCFCEVTRGAAFSVSEGTVNTLIGNHSSMLHIYQDVTLKWATQLPHVPVAVRVGCLHDLKGVVVTLSDDGHLQCSYLGTDPSLFQAPKVESRELNYDELDEEFKELKKIIRDVNRSQAPDGEAGADRVPSVTVKVTLQNRVVLQKARLSVCVQPPLVLTCDQFTFEFTAPDMTETAAFSVYLKRSSPPSELEGAAVVSYSRPTGFASQPDDDQVNVMGFQLLGGSRVTLLASRSSQRYRIQSEQFEDLWLITNELILRLQEYFEKQGVGDFACAFSGPLPLQEYFELIDRHFELRVNGEKLEELLSERAVQFRAIQRRLLTRFKDKTPAPLQHLDTLLDGTYKQVMALADAAEENQDSLSQSFGR
ncbi:Protein PTHB1 [Tupaia chinensis]|uniref:Protein PTHB1 n=1 Tax=Tupaia chinensis TaxID=246437 RepID=L8Y7H9_TUPCH|nr:Protein PTHB1 [Tupaia chinensis]